MEWENSTVRNCRQVIINHQDGREDKGNIETISTEVNVLSVLSHSQTLSNEDRIYKYYYAYTRYFY